MSKLRKILNEHFLLRFRPMAAAHIKYNDTEFDSKRVWVSRLLAQFLMSDVLVVSIDESSFKQAGIPKRCWQADADLVRELYRK